LGEHLLCKQGVIGSIPISSTILIYRFLIVATYKVTPIRKQAAQAAGFTPP
jgi:hypothetical protein